MEVEKKVVGMEVEKTEKKDEPIPGPEVEDFAHALDDCLSNRANTADQKSRILDLPQRFHDLTVKRLAKLRSSRQRDRQDDVDMDVDETEPTADPEPESEEDKEIKRLEYEAQTWDLLRRVLPLRYSGPKAITKSPFKTKKPARRSLLDDFLENNLIAQERLAILQWLQNNASSGQNIDDLVRELQQNADRGDIIAHGWLHTRSSIKLRKRVTAWPHLLDRQSSNIARTHVNSAGAPLVTQLDPDAVTRQGRKLEPQDEYFERAIWLGCFEHLRRGSSKETIRDWCQERTEMWRAISMSALPLSADDVTSIGDTDPSSLALWRRMCFGLARQGGSDDFERAVYGVLSGDIPSVEKVANSWDDFVFANYNALLRTQLDTFILSLCAPATASSLTQSFSSFDAVQYLGEQDGVEKRLVRTLESHKSTREEALEPNKALQAAFIAKDIGYHLYEQGLALVLEKPTKNKESTSLLASSSTQPNKFFSQKEHYGLRIVAHVYSLVSLLDRLDSRDAKKTSTQTTDEWRYAQESILAGYTEYLQSCKLQELIPVYCSILEAPRSYEVLSKSMIQEQDRDRRMLQLQLIKRAGIEVITFVKTQASLLYDAVATREKDVVTKAQFRIIEDGPPTARHGRPIKSDFFSDDEGAVDVKHENLVRSLEWLLMVTETWPDVFSVGTKVYKFFLSELLCEQIWMKKANLTNHSTRKHASHCRPKAHAECDLRQHCPRYDRPR